jgi:hypothetical protein
MSRIPAQGVVVSVGAVSIFASLCVLGGPPAWSSIDATSHPLFYTASSASLTSSPIEAQIVSGVSNAHTLAEGPGGVFSLEQPVTSSSAPAVGSTSAAVSTITTAPAVPAVPTAAAVAPTALPVHAAAKVVVPKVVAKSAIVAKAASVVTPRSIAEALAASHGWTGAQWVCLDNLWQHESKYETTVRNTRSGAYGIPQALPASKMATAGADWRTNPVTQIKWGLSYITARYGTACGAWQHEERDGSY